MTREDVLKLFPGATDEQITNLLNQNNSEIAKEKGKADKTKSEFQTKMNELQEKALKADELQKHIDELENGKLTELEKMQKELEKSAKRVEELEKENLVRKQRDMAIEKFKISVEQAGKVLNEDGTLDYDALGQIIAEKESAAALAKEQEIASASTNPGGKTGSSSDEDKSMAVRIVEKQFGKDNKQNSDIISMYAQGGK